jgi:hypothetical protein
MQIHDSRTHSQNFAGTDVQATAAAAAAAAICNEQQIPDPLLSQPTYRPDPLPSTSWGPIPSTPTAPYSLSLIREKFHYLRDWPDELLMGQSLGDLAVANTQARKMEDKSANSAVDKKVAINYKELRAKPIKVSEGWDDSISTLHSCRLLPGVVCPLNKLWEKAQAELPEAGIRPLIQYDMQSTGLPAYVSSKAWAELHQPGSPNLSLKLFLAANQPLTDQAVHGSKTDEAWVTSFADKLPEPTTVREVRKSLHAADRAQRLVTPWNFSICALAGYMETTDFCAEYFVGRTDQAAQLRRFIDSILSRNAAHFRAGMPFLTPQDIRNQWHDWAEQFGLYLGGRPTPAAKGQYAAAAASRSSDSRPGQQQLPPRNICRRYNKPEGCQTTGPSCIITNKDGKKFTLMHLCTAPIGGGSFCLMPHSKQDHK